MKHLRGMSKHDEQCLRDETCKRERYSNPHLSRTRTTVLRKDELSLLESKIRSLGQLIHWLTKNQYEIIGDPTSHFEQAIVYLVTTLSNRNLTNMGSANCSDLQCVKPRGSQRYHWRIYDYPYQIVVECHIDNIDPKSDPVGHIKEHFSHRIGLSKESKHNILVLKK